MKIHREGFLILLITGLLLFGINYAAGKYWPNASIITTALLIVSLVFYIIVLQFFRNPGRNTVANEQHVIAPADGKVVVIEEVVESEFYKDRRIQVSIFMSPFNVHVNRVPITGNIEYFRYHPGKYLVAWHPKSSTENERTTVVVSNGPGKTVLFRQIAGALARRIRWYIKEGQNMQQGQEMGFIKFGSRVDLYLPLGTEINVKINDTVRGGETVIAIFKS